MVLLLPNPMEPSPMHSKAKLLSPGYGEENAVLLWAPRKESRTAELSEGFQQSIFKGKGREEHPRVYEDFMHHSLIG